MTLASEKTPWFRHRRFGYGAGVPMCWQGWAMLGAHVSALFLLGGLLGKHYPAALLVAALALTLPLLPVYAARTEGGWKWRWGRRRV